MSQSPCRHPIHHRPRLRALAALLSALALTCAAIPAMADQPQPPKKTRHEVKDGNERTVARVEDDGLNDGYSAIYSTTGKRIGSIQDDGITGRSVIYNQRGQRVGVIDREPDFSRQNDGPLAADERQEDHP